MSEKNGNGIWRGYTPVWPCLFVKRTPPKKYAGKIELPDQSVAKVSHADGVIVAVPPENTIPENSDVYIDPRLKGDMKNGKAVGKKIIFGLYTGYDIDLDAETPEYGKDVITMIRFDEIRGIWELEENDDS